MVARFSFTKLYAKLGTWRLAAFSTFGSAVGYCALAIPMPIALMYAAIALTGFSLGISVTISIAGLMAITKPEMLGMSNSVRMVEVAKVAKLLDEIAPRYSATRACGTTR